MNRILKKIFFRHDAAKGGVFALSFLIAASWLWITLFHLLFLALTHVPMRLYAIWLIGEITIILYSVILFCQILGMLIKNCVQAKRWLPILKFSGAVTLLVSALFLTIGELFVLIKNVSFEKIPDSSIYAFFNTITEQEMWYCAVLVSGMLFLCGFFLFANALADSEKQKLRYVFGKATLITWGVVLAGYIIFTISAKLQESSAHAAFIAAEKRFNAPLSVEALQMKYDKLGKTDSKIWEHLQKLYKSLPQDYYDISSIEVWEEFYRKNQKKISAFEREFETVPPPFPQNFTSGNLWKSSRPWNICRAFITLEKSRLLFAMIAKDKITAINALKRIENCAEFLGQGPFLIDYLVWLAVENTKLNTMEKILESRLFQQNELQKLSNKLAELEKTIPLLHENAIYSEIIFLHDVMQTLEHGSPDFISLRPFFLIFPQIKLHFAINKKFLYQEALKKDFTFYSNSGPQYMLNISMAGYRFYKATAQIRAIRILINAEIYRQEHGDYPTTIAKLPDDPYTGNPMHYHYGETEDLVDGKIIKTRAIKVWSVGRNQKNDGGITFPPEKDDIGAKILLKK